MMKRTDGLSGKRLFYYVLLLSLLTLWLRIVVFGIYKVDCGGSDENVLFGIQRILLGQPLYQNPNLPDYAIIQYTPFFYYLNAAIAKLLGLHAPDLQALYQVARGLNICLNLLTILLAAAIIRSQGFSRRIAFTYALPAIMILTTHYYVRIDSLQLFFFTAAMAVYIRYLQRGGFWRLLLAAGLCGACVMAKQSGILAIGIIGFSLLCLERRILTAVLFGIVSVGAAAGIAWLCIGNNWIGLYQNPYLGLKNGIDWTWLYTIFISQFYFDLILCYFLGFIIAIYAFRHTTDKVYRFIGAGAVLSFFFALITGLKIGSSNNYFTELLLFVLLGLPLLLGSAYRGQKLFRIGQWTVTVRRFAGIAFFVLITSKTMGFFTSVYIEQRLVSEPSLYTSGQALHRYFKDSLALKQGEYVYFSQRDYLDNFFIGNSIMGCRDVILQTWKGAPGTFDYTPLRHGMNSGLIRYVVTHSDEKDLNERTREEMPILQFDPAHFRPKATIAGYTIYQYTE
jgi:4-amino-4-deoxy-L-arabinose transferase-like glycosyltransferase